MHTPNSWCRQRVRKLVDLLHQYGIHHHDVARRNVVVDETGKFTLIDFEQSTEGCSDKLCRDYDHLGPEAEAEADPLDDLL
jgi:tRNA A-37 threonylcarbamoyl transferase component Bud32